MHRFINGRYQFDQVIREACDKNKIIERYQYPDSSTAVVGVYKMRVFLYGLNYVLGSPIPIPKFIEENKNIISLKDVKNNMCFWACLALYFLRMEKEDEKKSKTIEDILPKWKNCSSTIMETNVLLLKKK